VGSTAKFEKIQIPVSPQIVVSGVIGIPEWWPTGARVGVVLAHDASGDMEQGLLTSLHGELAQRGYLCVRFNFPFAEQGKKRPDPPHMLERALRAAAQSLMRDPQDAPARLLVGGIGLGARTAADVVAQGMKADAVLALSFPLHPSGKPAQLRAESLFRIICPILFVQGTRNPTCRVDRLEALLRRVGAPTQLHVVEEADHRLEVVKRSGRSQEEVAAEVISAVDVFAARVTGQ
jgi:predicted alpha/beta-hydrolase family hydrolase